MITINLTEKKLRMKLATFLLIGVGVAIGFLLATDDKEQLITDIKDGFSKGKDLASKKLRKTFDEVSDNIAAMKE